jgi:hypothetical protein
MNPPSTGNSDADSRGGQKLAAIIVDFFGHFIRIQCPAVIFRIVEVVSSWTLGQ